MLELHRHLKMSSLEMAKSRYFEENAWDGSGMTSKPVDRMDFEAFLFLTDGNRKGVGHHEEIGRRGPHLYSYGISPSDPRTLAKTVATSYSF
jgi:hypothetical protein